VHRISTTSQALQDPNVWIADMGATVHSSLYKQQMDNIQKPQTAELSQREMTKIKMHL